MVVVVALVAPLCAMELRVHEAAHALMLVGTEIGSGRLSVLEQL